MKLVKLVKLNNLQYNTNRDPAFYRRAINEEFRLQALLDGSGQATARFRIGDNTVCESSVTLPGTFDCRFSYPDAGTRMGTLTIEANQEKYQQAIRVDVLEHAPIG